MISTMATTIPQTAKKNPSGSPTSAMRMTTGMYTTSTAAHISDARSAWRRARDSGAVRTSVMLDSGIRTLLCSGTSRSHHSSVGASTSAPLPRACPAPRDVSRSVTVAVSTRSIAH
ncbi:MAG: hypothetical protein KDB36_18850 [Acidimicrobiales bacterium]|nr:hypothetical protein [Acidimicrobiales bacterium]